MAEILHRHGIRTVIAGAKGVVLLHDRAARSDDSEGINLYAGSTLPESRAKALTALAGQIPRRRVDGNQSRSLDDGGH